MVLRCGGLGARCGDPRESRHGSKPFFRSLLADLVVAGGVAGDAVCPGVVIEPMIMRHDVLAERYRADPRDFPAVGALQADGDHLSLIHCHWLLTAAHVACDIVPGSTITMNDGQVLVPDDVILHPGFSDEPTEHDLALVRTSSPVCGISPMLLFGGSDEEGQTATFVGRGDFGTGLTGPIGNDGILRLAHNEIVGVSPQWLKFRFDSPADGCALALEGISGPGDSGGPALISGLHGSPFLAGISCWQVDDGEEDRYGVIEYYARVSSYLDWITSLVEF